MTRAGGRSTAADQVPGLRVQDEAHQVPGGLKLCALAKVHHETLGNISSLPPEAIEVLRASLAGKTLLVAGEGFEVTRSLPHGHVAAVWAMAEKLRLVKLLGPACAERDLALALIVARVCRPGLRLATTRWWPTPPWRRTWAWSRPPPTTCTRRWTGSADVRRASRPAWPDATWRRG